MLALLLALFVSLAYGEGPACSSAYTNTASGSGITTFNPDFFTAQSPDGSFPIDNPGNYPLPNPSWLVTVTEEGSGASETDFWFDTAGQSYWDDTQTLFDACAFIFRPPFPTATVKLSQYDPGDCSATLSSDCRKAIKQTVIQSAIKWTFDATSPPHSNLSAGVLPHICQKISDNLAPTHTNKYYFPAECKQDFGLEDIVKWPHYDILALTSNNRSVPSIIPSNGGHKTFTNLDYECPTHGRSGQVYYHAGRSDSRYDYNTQMSMATPILTVFFPVANAEAEPRVDLRLPSAQLTCPRVKQDRQGNPFAKSQQSVNLPSVPLPSADDTHLYIAIGCLAFILIACYTTVWICRREVLRRRAQEAADQQGDLQGKLGKLEAACELDTANTIELSPIERQPEIEGNQILELGTQGPVELDATRMRSLSPNSSRPTLSTYSTSASEE